MLWLLPMYFSDRHHNISQQIAGSNLVAFFITLTAAAILHAHGIIEISTSAQAAKELDPLAGCFAFLLFVCGIVGTGLLAVPVLAASACYGIGEACRWKTSLERKPFRRDRQTVLPRKGRQPIS
jgi:Mn2+/Fe2+ NRAMP family transporter